MVALMEVSVSQQAYVFFMMILAGGGAGILFDIFRVWRKIVRPGRVSTGISDILFWTLIGIGLFAVIYNVNNGELRVFEFMGIFIGALVYFLVFSHMCVAVFTGIAKILAKITLLILKIVLTPLIFLYKMIKRPILWIFNTFASIFSKVGTGAKRTGGKIGRGIKHFHMVSKKS